MTMRFLFIGLILLSLSSHAQDYFQQEVDYTIDVELDDESFMLRGQESLLYTNNSLDSLSFLVFHIWPNAYSSKKTALAKQLVRMGNTELHFATEDEMGFIDSLDFEVDGLPVRWTVDLEHVDICTLHLAKPIAPGENAEIKTPFRVKIPSGEISRLGHIDQSFQITQWYPKPAVYDRKGWHPMPYLTQGEFYSEYGSFDVSITLPSNYTVGATGDLQTQSEVDRLDSLVRKTETWIENRNTKLDWSEVREEMSFPASSEKKKTVRYIQSNVHDFAWFADKRYHVLKGEVELPNSGGKTTVWTMFTNKSARLWKESIEYMHDAVYYYSLWNGDYPYHQATAVDGTISAGGGMEYPNVTVIGDAQSPLLLETVIMHEVGHNWFYGILGSNERDFAWMDEGLNSYNEQRYLQTKYPNATILAKTKDKQLHQRTGLTEYDIKDQHYFIYLFTARQNSDQPLNTHSQDFSTVNYGGGVYSKSAVFFNYLRSYLGDDKMDAAMSEYFEAYKFKHPYPEDFRRVMESSTSENLSWLFDQGINNSGNLDYRIVRARNEDEKTTAHLKNTGHIDGPCHVALYDEEKLVESLWVEGFREDTTIVFSTIGDVVKIDPDRVMPEVNRENNQMRTKGVLKAVEPLQLNVVGKLENPRKNQLNILPVLLAMNVPGGYMPGIMLYNSIVPVKKLNYVVSPLYSLKGNTPTGFAEVYYMFTPQHSSFESIDVGAKAKRYVREKKAVIPQLTYNRIEPYIRLSFRPPSYSGLWSHELKLSSVVVLDQVHSTDANGKLKTSETTDVYNRINYDATYRHPVYHTSASIGGEQHTDFLKFELNLENKLNLNDQLKVRSSGFIGVFVSNTSNQARYNFRMDGVTPRNDYAYDATLFDRSHVDGLLSRQFATGQGALKIPTAVGQSNLGIASFGTEFIYGKIPVGLFADVGYSFQGELVADAGVHLSLLKDFFSLYLPLVYTSNIQNEISANGTSIPGLIRFEIKTDIFHLMELRRTFEF